MDCISVIVPLYKGKKYISPIIDMVCKNVDVLHSNNINCNVELIFINDYPQDRYLINIDKFKQCILDIRFLFNDNNLGIHASRVKGIKASRGNYILMLDQDDMITRDFLYSQYIVLKTQPNSPMIIANGYIEHPTYTRLIYKTPIMQRMAKRLIFYALLDNRIISPGQCLIRKKVIPELWLEHHMSTNGADDLMLWSLILSNGSSGQTLLNKKRLYTHKNTNENTSLDLVGMYNSVREMLELLEENQYRDKQFLQITKYRNSCLNGKACDVNINLFYRLIIHMVYFIRKSKAISK